MNIKNSYPLLPIRDIVVFPHILVPLFVGRDISVKAIDAAMASDQLVLLVAQKNQDVEAPVAEDLYEVGVLVKILQFLKLPEGTVKVMIEAQQKVNILNIHSSEGYFNAEYSIREDIDVEGVENVALKRAISEKFVIYAKLNKKVSAEILDVIDATDKLSLLIDFIIGGMPINVVEKQALLEIDSVIKRGERLLSLLEGEIDVINAEKRIKNRVKKQVEKNQRDYYLNEQMKAIQKELGDDDENKDELSSLEKKSKKIKFSKEAREKVYSEIRKLKNMAPMSAESTVVRNYLDWMFSIPWGVKADVESDIVHAKNVLDEEHFGLEKVKDRILEFLAVHNRVGKVTGQVLCLVGPPGVGKTSLAKSIARATGRPFIKISLGGVRDESEIRGHRRTYIGSMPGKIIQGMKKAKFCNPLILLDEIDKIGADWRGDPSSALLEVLDTEQNANFSDHYIEVDYDLSDVMFVATANSLQMPRPLLDRMEILRISGYTELEKFEIAKSHLIEKQMELAGLSAEDFRISDDAVLELIRGYTREAGVRALERELANIMRKSVRQILELSLSDEKKDVATSVSAPLINIEKEHLLKYSGVPKFRYSEIEEKNMVGVVTGLAWTEVGGEILSIEALMVPGKGKTTLTGKLGDVMQESIQASISFVRSRASNYGIDSAIFEKNDFHIHVPEGATPKDGPSAGVAMVTSIVSAITGIPIKKEVAMTGEITLRGRVLPIGGLKEKLLAAHRGMIKTVIIPLENKNDLTEIPLNITENLNIISVDCVDKILDIALERSPIGRANPGVVC